MQTEYIPKGGLCMTCKGDKCPKNHEFENMIVIQKYRDGVKAVKCTGYKRKVGGNGGKA